MNMGKRILPISVPIIILAVLGAAILIIPVWANPAPTPLLTIKIEPDSPVSGEKFLLVAQLSWMGPSDLYSIALPSIKPPEDLQPGGITTTVTVENGITKRSYSYEMNPERTGNYTIDPIEFKLINKTTGEETKLKSETVKLAITKPKAYRINELLEKMRVSAYSRYFGIILILFGVALGIATVITIKKIRGRILAASETTTPEK